MLSFESDNENNEIVIKTLSNFKDEEVQAETDDMD